jgi:hypothetical protein
MAKLKNSKPIKMLITLAATSPNTAGMIKLYHRVMSLLVVYPNKAALANIIAAEKNACAILALVNVKNMLLSPAPINAAKTYSMIRAVEALTDFILKLKIKTNANGAKVVIHSIGPVRKKLDRAGTLPIANATTPLNKTAAVMLEKIPVRYVRNP